MRAAIWRIEAILYRVNRVGGKGHSEQITVKLSSQWQE